MHLRNNSAGKTLCLRGRDDKLSTPRVNHVNVPLLFLPNYPSRLSGDLEEEDPASAWVVLPK